VEQYDKNRAALTVDVPAVTRNAVSTALGTTADMQRTGRAEDGPVSAVKSFDANMPNGSIRTVYQDSTYPGAETAGGGVARAQAPNIQFAQFPQGGGSDFNTVQSGGGGNGLFSPGISSQMQDLYTRSNALLSSKSMVDNWRGRQLAKMRDRMMLSESAMGNTRVGAANAQANMLGAQSSALRAANEVPLAMMGDYTQQRGQDVQGNIAKMHDATQRYGIDTTSATHNRATDASMLVHASDILRGQQQVKAVANGSLDDVENVTHAFGGQYPRTPATGHWTSDGMGGGVYVPPGGGLPIPYTPQQLKEEANKRRLESKTPQLYPPGSK
jgi:hypothetical protein